jgi:hypothetical protein
MNVREVQVLSKMPLKEWHCDLTNFHKYSAVIPSEEFQQLAWPDLLDAVDFLNPKTLAYKKKAKTFIPCLLKDAPLVGKGLINATTTIGKMRSPNHVTEARLLVIDIDGMDENLFNESVTKLREDNVTFAWYCTFSQDRPDLYGMDVRVLVPIDKALESHAYAAAARGLGARYFNQQFKAILSQQQSVRVMKKSIHWFCVHIEPINYEGGVISADFLISGVTHA